MNDYTELDAMREDYLRYLNTRHPHETIQKMVDYTSRLQQVLVSEGYTANYTPVWDEYSQKVTVHLNGVDGGIGRTTGITINPFRLAIINLLPEESDISVHTVKEALAALEGAITRWRAYTFQHYVESVLIWWKHPIDQKWRQEVREQCSSCYYSCGYQYCGERFHYCGLGMTPDVACASLVPKEITG
jgi:hypothetical protein